MEQKQAEARNPQVVLITGSTDGLGREVALRAAATGDHVIVHGRDAQRGREVVAEIKRRGGGGSARFCHADFSSLEEVRKFGETMLSDYDRLDVLINNAGIGSAPRERVVSADGHELRFAVNYLSHFLLTRILLPRIVASSRGRIINVASAAQTPLDFEDVMITRDFSGPRAYAQSKLAQILFTIDLAQELEGTGVVVTALHPATFMDTTMVRRAGVTPTSSVDEGATAVMNLISGDVESGHFLNGLQTARANPQAYEREARERLRRISEELLPR